MSQPCHWIFLVSIKKKEKIPAVLVRNSKLRSMASFEIMKITVLLRRVGKSILKTKMDASPKKTWLCTKYELLQQLVRKPLLVKLYQIFMKNILAFKLWLLSSSQLIFDFHGKSEFTSIKVHYIHYLKFFHDTYLGLKNVPVDWFLK